MGLRSLPFFKAKKGWQFAGGGLSSETGGGGGGSLPIATAETLGGVRIGSGVNVANDGTISTDLHIKTYNLTDPIKPNVWVTLESNYNKSVLFCVAVTINSGEKSCIPIQMTSVNNNGDLMIKSNVSMSGQITIYVFEKEV